MAIPLPGRSGIALAITLLMTGCVSYPYGPSYYNQGPYSPAPVYGPTMAPPGGYMAPGPTYTPTGPALQPLPGNPGYPNSPTPIAPSQTAPTWRPDTSSPSTAPLDDAPPFRPNPSTNSTNPVPFPVEPDFSAPPSAGRMPRAVPVAEAPGVNSRPVSTISSDDPFQPPQQAGGTTEPDPFAIDGGATTVSKQEPYGFDGDKYTWLRGMVDFDERSKTWSIIYNLTPDARDKFGGSFVFADHPSLKSLRPGTLILAKGRVDPGRTDGTGKALYEIVQLIHLAPPAGIQ